MALLPMALSSSAVDILGNVVLLRADVRVSRRLGNQEVNEMIDLLSGNERGRKCSIWMVGERQAAGPENKSVCAGRLACNSTSSRAFYSGHRDHSTAAGVWLIGRLAGLRASKQFMYLPT